MIDVRPCHFLRYELRSCWRPVAFLDLTFFRFLTDPSNICLRSVLRVPFYLFAFWKLFFLGLWNLALRCHRHARHPAGLGPSKDRLL